MATAAQVQAFASSWAPYAVSVGQRIGVDPNILLAQWGMESGYGTNSGSRQNNVAGITRDGVPGHWASYGSQQDFADAFTSLVQRMYPNAVNTGSDVNAYTQGLASGRSGSYFGTQSAASYAAAVQGGESAIGRFASAVTGTLAPGYADNPIQYDPQTGQVVANPANAGQGEVGPGDAGALWGWVSALATNGGAIAAGVLIVVVVTAASLIGGRSPVQVIGRIAKG